MARAVEMFGSWAGSLAAWSSTGSLGQQTAAPASDTGPLSSGSFASLPCLSASVSVSKQTAKQEAAHCERVWNNVNRAKPFEQIARKY